MATKKEAEVNAARVYEVGYHILPNVEGEAIEKVVQGVREMIAEMGGSLIAEGTPQDMHLAYTMYINNEGKNTSYDRAHFGWIKFELPAEKIAALEESLKLNKKILRSIVFRTVKEETRASVKIGALREVKRSDTLKVQTRPEKEVVGEVSEEKLDEAIEGLTAAN
ncbi:MAG: 30S ribosomal protein S6 [Candidatus Pacebacteria bacterium]|nr:30S ribosomal protein S6 [Candidatus Paceibacterota bacterium]